MKIKQIDKSITPHIVTFCVVHVLRANKTLGLSKFQENHPILLIMVKPFNIINNGHQFVL